MIDKIKKRIKRGRVHRQNESLKILSEIKDLLAKPIASADNSVGQSTVMSLPYDQYAETTFGIFVKAVRSIDELDEPLFLKYVTEEDFKDNIVIMTKASKGSCFGAHYHLEREELRVIEGYMLEGVTDELYGPSGILVNEPLKIHSFTALTDCIFVTLVGKNPEITTVPNEISMVPVEQGEPQEVG